MLNCFPVHVGPIEDMDDQCVGLRAARDLMMMPYYKLKPELHLKLLHALCNDIANCQGMKNAMTVRIEEVSRLNTEKIHADAEVFLGLSQPFLKFFKDAFSTCKHVNMV